MKKEIKTRNYNLQIKRSLNGENEGIDVEININQQFKRLLDKFTIKTDKLLETGYFKKYEVDSSSILVGKEKINRYLVKSILMNSVSWNNFLSMIFSKELIDKRKLKFQLASMNSYDTMVLRSDEVRELIHILEKLCKIESKVVDIKVIEE